MSTQRPEIKTMANLEAAFAGESMAHIKSMKTYLCSVYGFIYDETAGRPEDGSTPGTCWADVPESWACPEYGVVKADFEAVEI